MSTHVCAQASPSHLAHPHGHTCLCTSISPANVTWPATTTHYNSSPLLPLLPNFALPISSFLASLLLHFSERFSTQFFLFSYSLCLSVPPRLLTEMAFAKANRYSHVVKFNKCQSALLHFFLFTQSQECWTQFTILLFLITLQGFHDFTYSCFCFLLLLSALVYFFSYYFPGDFWNQ